MNSSHAGEEVPLLSLLPILKRMVRLADTHKQYGLTQSQAVVIIALKNRGSVTMSEVAQYLSSSREQATRAVAALYDRGLVERFELPRNRTHVYIRFTEAGEKLTEELEAHLHEQISTRLQARLSTEEIAALRSSVQTSIDLLNKALGEE